MKKHLIIIGLVLLATMLVPSICFAEEKPIADLLAAQDINMHAEKAAIEKLLTDESLKAEIAKSLPGLGRPGQFDGVKSKEDFSYGKPYKIISLPRNMQASPAFFGGDDFASLLKDSEHFWEVPIIKHGSGKIIGSIAFGQKIELQDKNDDGAITEGEWRIIEGVWELDTIPGYLSPKQTELTSNPEAIEKLFAKHGVTKGTRFLCLVEGPISFLYVKGSEKDHFIALTRGKDEVGAFKDMKVYERNEAVNAELRAVFYPSADENGLTRGGSSGGGSSEVKPLAATTKDVSAPRMADQTGDYSGYYLPAFLAMLALATLFIRHTRARANG